MRTCGSLVATGLRFRLSLDHDDLLCFKPQQVLSATDLFSCKVEGELIVAARG